jgi:HD-GYP domain-containing protein (c-di-GMP phosphodiesterase class II)
VDSAQNVNELGTARTTRRSLQDKVLDLMIERIELLNAIGTALSSERDPVRLMEAILVGAKSLTGADGGTIYLFDEKDDSLRFEILRTDSLGIALGGTSGTEVTLPPVPLHHDDGSPNRESVVAYAVLEDKTVNLADAYRAKGFDFAGTRAFDRTTGYRSMSMLTVPMRNHDQEIIGVLQLLNAKAGDGDTTIPFSAFSQRLAESVASQAAIALTRQELMEDMEGLFESFVRLIADAIDAKSPHTGGHCRRVPEIAMLLADAASESEHASLANFSLNDVQRYELHIAALLHDCGKITTPEWVMDKATKLQTVFDRVHLVETRYALLRQRAEFDRERAVLAGTDPAEAEQHFQELLTEFAGEIEFLRTANQGSEFMTAEAMARVRSIAARRWVDHTGTERSLLTEDEVDNLCIQRGTLNVREREIIQNHIVATINMLESLPYPKHLRQVPEYAGAHHERCDGKGYPRGLFQSDMSIPARIMGIADVFEALTAADRPYKKPMPMSQALTILGRMAEEGHIDPDLFRVFVRREVWRAYGEANMRSEQFDEVDIETLPGMK